MESLVQNSTLDPQLVSTKAYEIWEAQGRPEGAAERTWLEAERLLRQTSPQASQQASRPSARPPAVIQETSSAKPALEPEPAQAADVSSKSEAPAAPTSAVQQKKPSTGNRRGSRR